MTQQSNNDERQPLLTESTHRDQSSTPNSVEVDGRPPTQPTSTITAKQHNEDDSEAAWFAELQKRPWYHRPSAYWIMLWLVAVGITTSLSNNSIEQLKIQVICIDLLGLQGDGGVPGNFTSALGGVRALVPADQCNTEAVIGFVALLKGRVGAILGIFTLLTLAKWTSLSDVLGRKFLLHVVMCSICASLLLNWFAASRFNIFGYHVYYIEAVVTGLVPSVLVNPTIVTYTADCTPKDQRSLVIGFLLTSFALGNILGSPLGGYISHATGDLTVVVKISLMSTALLAIYLSFLPESLKTRPVSLTQWMKSQTDSEDNNTISTQRKEATSIAQSFKHAYSFIKTNLSTIFDPLLLFVPGHVPQSKNMASMYTPALIVLCLFFIEIALTGRRSLFIPMTNLLFHWGALEDGFYDIFSHTCNFVTFLVIFPVLQAVYKRVISNSRKDDVEAAARPLMHNANESHEGLPKTFEQRDIGAIKMDLSFTVGGLVLLVVALLLFPLIPTVPVLYISGALSAVGQIAHVTGTSLLSSVMPDHLTGAAIGALTVITSLAAIVSDLAYGLLLSLTVETWPLLYYYISAGLCTLALTVATINWWSYRRK
ncbi:MAG: major facilitator superfamily domain-containing protein [Linnemannia gamsii]|nr:MAG: major facilitator superfamily domain-containing protein [Linnemannia gamsii]